MNWSFTDVWNQSISVQNREIKPRDYIYASEIGGSYINRYMSMKGIVPTNPPNARSLRKFAAGNLWEWVVKMVLVRAGIMQSTNQRLEYNFPHLLRVSGRQDFLAGGVPDLEKARRDIEAMGLPEEFKNASLKIVDHIESLKLVELDTIVLEIKSSAGNMFDYYERIGGNPMHRSQTMIYLLGFNLPEGLLVYINKDNCLLNEVLVRADDTKLLEATRADIEQMTYYYNNSETPPKDEEIIFDNFSFKTNWKVEYSNYLTMLYGYERPDIYREKYDKMLKGWTRVFKRVVADQKMTKLNLEVITEAKKYFPNWDELVDMAKEHKELMVEEEDEVA